MTFNTGSIRAAKRFGFKEEGICRNLNGIVPLQKRIEGEKDRKSQDLWLSSMVDTDWNDTFREIVEGMVKRDPLDTTLF